MSQIVPRYYRIPAAVFSFDYKVKILRFTSWLLLPLFRAWRLALGAWEFSEISTFVFRYVQTCFGKSEKCRYKVTKNGIKKPCSIWILKFISYDFNVLLTDFFRKFPKRVSENLKNQNRKIPKSPKRQAPLGKWKKKKKMKKKTKKKLTTLSLRNS